MAKKKVYAVRKGNKIGVFDSWAECQKQTSGFSGAEFQSFSTISEAKTYLNQTCEEAATLDVDQTDNIIETDYDILSDSERVHVYVDGSFKPGIDRYSYGILILHPDGTKEEDSGYHDRPEALESRNVAGELLGTMIAIEKCFQKGYSKIIIFHDYEGISKWYNKEWKANKFVSKQYVEFVEKHRNHIDIKFKWVKGHSDNEYNDLVDKLAKTALIDKQPSKQGDNFLSVDNFKQSDIESIIELLDEEEYLNNENFKIHPNSSTKSCISWVLLHSKERLVINYYPGTKKLVVQGVKKELFLIVQTYILELTDNETIHNAYRKVYNIEIDKNSVEEEIHQYLPNKNNNLNISDKLEHTIKQAILNLRIDGDMYEYTQFTFPAFRALEGFLMAILKKHKIRNGNNFTNTFDEKSNETYKLKDKYNNNFGSPSKIQYINKLYTYYKNNRHTFFHWDDYEGTDTTKILDERSWKSVVLTILKLMNEYYLVN